MTAPVQVDPHAIFNLDAAAEALAPLGISPSCLRREARLGRLRVARRGGHYLLTGRQLLAWAEGRSGRRRAASVNGLSQK
jgi:hypothetical protein